MFTVLFCGNVAGTYLPPYVIYKGKAAKTFNTWMERAPDSTAYTVTKSGLMEDFVLKHSSETFSSLMFLTKTS